MADLSGKNPHVSADTSRSLLVTPCQLLPMVPPSIRSFRRSYLVAIGTLFALAVLSQCLVQSALSRETSSAALINTAGRQRMLSQRIAKVALVACADHQRDVTQSLRASIEEFNGAHQWLAQHPATPSQIRVQLATAGADARSLVAAARAAAHGCGPMAPKIDRVLQTEAAFLHGMQSIVDQYESVSGAHLSSLRRLELALFIAMLVVLALEALIIFEPMRSSLLRAMRFLSRSRAEAFAMAEERHRQHAARMLDDEVLATASHEIRAPLVGMVGMSAMLVESSKDDVQRRLASRIERSGQDLLQLVNTLLDASQVQSGSLQLEKVPVNLVDLADALIRPTAAWLQDSSVVLSTRLHVEPYARILGDALRLKQVGHNLLNNAAKFTMSGEIILTVAVRKRNGAHELVLGVDDTGVGIHPDRLEDVFERYRQADDSTARRFGGTGLGLSISRGLIESMGGTLTVTSEEGVGSHFIALVPVELAPDRTDDPEEPPAVIPAGRRPETSANGLVPNHSA